MKLATVTLLAFCASSAAVAQTTSPGATKPAVTAPKVVTAEGVKPAPAATALGKELGAVVSDDAKEERGTRSIRSSPSVLAAEEAKILAGTREAQEKADMAMQAATNGLALSVASGTAQVSGGVVSPTAPPPQGKSKSTGQKPKP